MNGKQFFRKTSKRTWKEAEQFRAQLMASMGMGEDTTATAVSIREALDQFIRGKRLHVSKDVADRYKVELTRLLEFCEGKGIFLPAGITSDVLVQFRETWPSIYPSTHTQSSVAKRTRSFLRFCHDEGWLPRLPRITPVAITASPTQPLTPAEYAALLKAVTDPHTRVLIELMRWTGLAIRDASTLKRTSLIHDKAKGFYRVVTARQKNGVDVSVPLVECPDLAATLLALPGTDHFFCAPEQLGPACAKVWGAKVSEAFDAANIVSLGQMRSHRLRDTFACHLLSEGMPIEEVSRLLGHRSIATTERSYSQWAVSRQNRVDDLMLASAAKKAQRKRRPRK